MTEARVLRADPTSHVVGWNEALPGHILPGIGLTVVARDDFSVLGHLALKVSQIIIARSDPTTSTPPISSVALIWGEAISIIFSRAFSSDDTLSSVLSVLRHVSLYLFFLLHICKMLELSYWLFPAIFLFFFFVPSWRCALLPGLLAACVAGAANGAVLRKYVMAAGHGCAGALVLCLSRPEKEKKRATWEESSTVFGAWLALSLLTALAIPECSWPYALDKNQMLSLFLPSLLVGLA